MEFARGRGALAPITHKFHKFNLRKRKQESNSIQINFHFSSFLRSELIELFWLLSPLWRGAPPFHSISNALHQPSSMADCRSSCFFHSIPFLSSCLIELVGFSSWLGSLFLAEPLAVPPPITRNHSQAKRSHQSIKLQPSIQHFKKWLDYGWCGSPAKRKII